MPRQYGAPREQPGGKGNSYEDRKDPAPRAKDPDPSPDTKTVEDFHKNAATDIRREDQHHTLGPGAFQASPGDHSHNGDDSVLLLEGFTINGTLTNPTSVLPSIISALVRLGADDGTS